MKRVQDTITKEESAAAVQAQAPYAGDNTERPATVAPINYPQGESILNRQLARMNETKASFILTDTDEYNLGLALAEANKLAFSMVDYMPVKELFENNVVFVIVDAAEVEIQQLVGKTMELVNRIVLKLRDVSKPDSIMFCMFAPNQVRDKFPSIFNQYRLLKKRAEIGPCELIKGKNSSKGNPPWLFRAVDQTKPFISVFNVE